ncbi:pyridoxamine 5'-phosphate oxidase family protein [Streptomyces sp. NPDC006283]|uniref:pyridoxamine 5'-phosphate oxidase family protein n=1 Tax=Streptomyces sp. NPDC006283 TaxID=3156741 RepID=UPI0033BAD880
MTSHSVPSQSIGERQLQSRLGTTHQASGFYRRQVQGSLTSRMREFIARQTMVFISTADANGACDSSFRAGPPGFVSVLDDHTLTYPEYRGNGVMASAGNLTENPHIGLLFMDFTHHHIGLHVNGIARLHRDVDQRLAYPQLPVDTAPGRRPDMWVHIVVEEAYVHCSKHIPHLEPAARPRSASAGRPKDAEYFVPPTEVRHDRAPVPAPGSSPQAPIYG